jgi:hypothetical protein
VKEKKVTKWGKEKTNVCEEQTSLSLANQPHSLKLKEGGPKIIPHKAGRV